MKRLVLLALLASTSITAQVSASADPAAPPMPTEKKQLSAVAVDTATDQVAEADALILSYGIEEPSTSLKSLVRDWVQSTVNIKQLIKYLHELQERYKITGFTQQQQKVEVLHILLREKRLKETLEKYNGIFDQIMQTGVTEPERNTALQKMFSDMDKEKEFRLQTYLAYIPAEIWHQEISKHASAVEFSGFAAACVSGMECEREARNREMRESPEEVSILPAELTPQRVVELNALSGPISLTLDSKHHSSTPALLGEETTRMLVDSLSKIKNLQSLNLAGDYVNGELVERIVPILQAMPNFAALTVSAGHLNISGINALQKLPKLRRLTLGSIRFSPEEMAAFIAVLSNFERLQEFRISNWTAHLSGSTWEALIQKMPNLSKLAIHALMPVDTVATLLTQVSLNMPYLEELELDNGILQQDPEGIRSLIPLFQKIKRLKVLKLSQLIEPQMLIDATIKAELEAALPGVTVM